MCRKYRKFHDALLNFMFLVKSWPTNLRKYVQISVANIFFSSRCQLLKQDKSVNSRKQQSSQLTIFGCINCFVFFKAIPLCGTKLIFLICIIWFIKVCFIDFSVINKSDNLTCTCAILYDNRTCDDYRWVAD